MTFTYTGDPASSERDAVRFLVGDTEEDQPFLADGEIDWIIDQWREKDHVYFYAATAAETIAAKLAREVSFSADGQSISLSELMQKFQSLSSSLRAQYNELLTSGVELHAGGMVAGELSFPGVLPLAFGTGMHDHWGAGPQDYGDRTAPYDAGQWGEFTS